MTDSPQPVPRESTVANAKFPLMDSVRALAALSVLAHHALPRAGADEPGRLLGPYVDHMDAGVAVFFVVSGCLLYRPFVAALARGTRRPETAAYGWRRALRIYPAFWVVLLATVAAGGYALDPSDTFAQLALGQVYGVYDIALPQAWTLCIEISFYAFVPLAALLARCRWGWLRTQIVALVALAAVSVVWKLSHAPGWLPFYLDQFALGMGLAVLSVKLGMDAPSRALRALARWSGLGWLLAAGAFLASIRFGFAGHFLVEWHAAPAAQLFARHACAALIGLGVALPAVLGAGGIVRRVLAWRPLLYLGTVSYGLYLWQFFALDHLLPAGPAFVHPYLWQMLGGLAVTTALAALSYHFVEAPAMRLKRLSRPSARIRDAVAATAS